MSSSSDETVARDLAGRRREEDALGEGAVLEAKRSWRFVLARLQQAGKEERTVLFQGARFVEPSARSTLSVGRPKARPLGQGLGAVLALWEVHEVTLPPPFRL